MSRPTPGWSPLHVLGKPLSDFLEEFLFASAGLIAQPSGLSNAIIKDITQRELRLRRFSRRWLPRSLSESPKADRVAMASGLLTLLRGQARFSFPRIMRGDESLFFCLYQSDHMFAASRDDMIPRKKHNCRSESSGNDFFCDAKLISLQALPSDARFTQEYFINTILPDIVHERGQIFRRVHQGAVFVHMENSTCHLGRKVTGELKILRFDSVPNPPDSRDLSPCDFLLFGMLKQSVKDRVFQTIEEILYAIRHL
jgi:hypothetical protein